MGGNGLRLFITRVALSTALVFGTWATVRIMVLKWIRENRYVDDDKWLTAFTDVEIHSLQMRPGWDLLAIPLLALAILIAFRGARLAESVFCYGITTSIALMFAVGTAYYPAAVLGGHIGSRWSTFTTQSVAVAVTAVAGLFLIAVIMHPLTRTFRMKR